MARDTKVSHGQISQLIGYMEEHKDFANGRLIGPTARIHSGRMWENLTSILNADGSGPTKPVHKWQKTWADLKSYTKKKYSKAKGHAAGTGGGPPLTSNLTPHEERVLALMTIEAVEGDTSLEEASPLLPLDDIPIPCIEIEVGNSELVLENELIMPQDTALNKSTSTIEKPQRPQVQQTKERGGL